MMFNWKTMFVGLLLVSLIVVGRLIRLEINDRE